MDNILTVAIDMLHSEKCSCVILSEDAAMASLTAAMPEKERSVSVGCKITICRERGVKDLYRILNDSPLLLEGSRIADKVIGKGAAALMALGKVREVYADVISEPALRLLDSAGIPVSYTRLVPNIINRAGTGICPVESICKDAATAEECLPLITCFLSSLPS